MSDRKVELKNFIGVYDNFILPKDCDELIRFYEERNKFNQVVDRVAFENQDIDQKQDSQYFASFKEMDVWVDHFKPLIVNFDLALQLYLKATKPKKGRIVIWPAGFPYLHRGNPPLSGEKYIVTSWMYARENIY